VLGDSQHFASFIFQPFDDVLSDDVRSCCLSAFLSGMSGLCYSVNQRTGISQILLCVLGNFDSHY